jgi:ATP adenylyltransferase
VVASNNLAVAIRDGFPVTPHHTLVLPRRHVVDWFDLYRPARAAIERLLDEQRGALQAEDPSIAGFNIGINAGEAAGQTIFHCHVT